MPALFDHDFGGNREGVLGACPFDHGAAAAGSIDVGDDVADRVTVNWLEPHRRVAVGQSVVVYADAMVVAGGLAIRAD